MIDYLAARLPPGGAEAGACLSQRAFYKLRRATCTRLGADRLAVRADTPLAALFAGEEGERAWQDVQIDVGAAHWPRLGRKPLVDRALAPHLNTFGEAADFLATRCPVAVQEDGPGWTRPQIADVVCACCLTSVGPAKGAMETAAQPPHLIRCPCRPTQGVMPQHGLRI